MASVDWKKIKTPNEVKAVLFHNSKETRTKTKEHSNADIDPTRTAGNYSLDGLTYAARCKRYDDRIAQLDSTTNTNKRKDRVTAICLALPRPKDLPPEKYADWFAAAYALMVDRFGADNVIGGDVHVDEVHDYIHSISGKLVTSREHLHLTVIPVDESGKLNAKAIETRANMRSLNNDVEQMSQRQFGVQFMTGEGRKGAAVEQMKQESAAAVMKQSRANRKRTKDLQEAAQMLSAQAQEQSAKEAALNAREAELNEREAAQRIKEAALNAKEAELKEREDEAERVKAVYQNKIKQHDRHERGASTFADAPTAQPQNTKNTARFDCAHKF